MITNTKIESEVKANFLAQQVCNIDPNMVGKMIGLLRQDIYSRKELAVCREYYSNAVDAHIEAGVPINQIEITAPTVLDPRLIIQDFGTGMTEQEALTLFTSYGKSTKDALDTPIGGFGIGSKSAWCYANMFTVVTVKDEQETQLVCVKDATDIDTFGAGTVNVINRRHVKGARNGTKIIVQVEQHHIHSFHAELQYLLNPLTADEMPICHNMDIASIILHETTINVDVNDKTVLCNLRIGDAKSPHFSEYTDHKKVYMTRNHILYNSAQYVGIIRSDYIVYADIIDSINTPALSRETIQNDDVVLSAVQDAIEKYARYLFALVMKQTKYVDEFIDAYQNLNNGNGMRFFDFDVMISHQKFVTREGHTINGPSIRFMMRNQDRTIAALSKYQMSSIDTSEFRALKLIHISSPKKWSYYIDPDVKSKAKPAARMTLDFESSTAMICNSIDERPDCIYQTDIIKYYDEIKDIAPSIAKYLPDILSAKMLRKKYPQLFLNRKVRTPKPSTAFFQIGNFKCTTEQELSEFLLKRGMTHIFMSRVSSSSSSSSSSNTEANIQCGRCVGLFNGKRFNATKMHPDIKIYQETPGNGLMTASVYYNNIPLVKLAYASALIGIPLPQDMVSDTVYKMLISDVKKKKTEVDIIRIMRDMDVAPWSDDPQFKLYVSQNMKRVQDYDYITRIDYFYKLGQYSKKFGYFYNDELTRNPIAIKTSKLIRHYQIAADKEEQAFRNSFIISIKQYIYKMFNVKTPLAYV